MNKIYSICHMWQFCKGLIKLKTGQRYIVAAAIVVVTLLNANFSYGQYCLPAWSAPSCDTPLRADFIDAFSFSNINNSNIGCPTAFNYIDFSTGACINVCSGNNYVATFSPGYYLENNDEFFAVAIDFNGNGNFSDPGEFFFIGNSFLGNTISGVITIPLGTPSINTRMRIICQTVFGPQLSQNDVCGNQSTYGEAIDYCIHIDATPQVNLGGPYAQCGGSVRLDATNPGPGTIYAWSDTSTSQVIEASTSGNYQVTVTTTAGCVGVSNPVNVYIKPVPVVNLGPDISQCAGTVTLDAGNNGTASYLWSNTSTASTITVNATGPYSVTATNIASGCTAADTINVAIHGLPVINLGPSVFQCGGSVSLDAGNPNCTYHWSTGASSRILTVSSSGLYSVTVTTPDGCSATAEQEVTIYPKPDLGEDIIVNVCPGTLVNLYDYYQHDGWPTTYYSPNPSAVGPGVYIIVATNDNGCTDTAQLTVVQNPKPNLGADVTDSICPGTTIDLTQVYSQGEEGQYTTYNWNNPNPTQASAGVYTLIVSNSYGCTDTAVANIVFSQMPPVTLNFSPNVCITEPPFLITQGSPAGGNYYIDGLENNIFVPNFLGVGLHHVKYVYHNVSGCIDSATVDVMIRPQPFITVSIPASALCSTSEPLDLNDHFTPPGGTYSGLGVVGNIFYPILTPPGIDTVVDIYVDNYGCSDTSIAILNVLKPVHVSLYASDEDYTICQGQSITFTGAGAQKYQFFVDGVAQGGSSSNNTFTSSSLANHSEITLVGSNQCSTDTSDFIIIDVLPLPVVSAGADTTIILGQSVELNGTATGSGSLVYQWAPGTGLDFTNVPNPTYSGSDSILFTFKATDTYGCADSSMVNVYVVIPDNVQLPNVITPNGDGKNDVWKLNPKINLTGSHLVIFNRWGQTVYEVDNYANNWGGTYKTLTGDKLPDDTYYYVLTVPAQHNHEYKGPINILSGTAK